MVLASHRDVVGAPCILFSIFYKAKAHNLCALEKKESPLLGHLQWTIKLLTYVRTAWFGRAGPCNVGLYHSAERFRSCFSCKHGSPDTRHVGLLHPWPI